MKTALLMAGVALAIGTAAQANADITAKDQAFLTTLNQAGLVYMSPERAISAAKSVCDLADGGMEGADIVKNLQDKNPGFEGDGAAKFAALAAQSYCPQKLSGGDSAPPPKSGNA
ncbi:hypothetical protein BN971_00808 [Mycobacterium bohemicum DSM 44277]|uniref:DUF732 domain-containing protein n=2 Tax=Mycobacterium bohemicum TaxID=56425 RepID=A0A1X1R228_MYCBE|nr:DUF732 domain-containing protein [Mycobacterium bohemicum]MCV6972174.1 DUF732 domain-containing protein [Mycobacterium bohemicum]ORU98244.1 hypothetical protein AWB93_15425 [Mycobacterium bohemicum]CPR06574.1 hypothetical protein BN971_00808 [Mycobacterium bohemicum DSM 44277]